jgi:hypothetical protein
VWLPSHDLMLVMHTQTVTQIVSAVEGRLDAMRQAQEDDSYIRRALSSNASTAQWPQHGAPPSLPRDGFTNPSTDTVQVCGFCNWTHLRFAPYPRQPPCCTQNRGQRFQ